MSEPLDDARELDEVLKAFGRATTQTRIDYSQRREAIMKVEKFLQKLRAAPARCDAGSELAQFLMTEAKVRKANDDGIWELLEEAAAALVPTPSEAGREYPSTDAMKAAVELEIHAALGQVQTVVIGRMIQKAIDAALSLDPGTVAVVSADYCTPDGPADCEAWAADKRCSSCPVTSADRGTAP